VALTTATKAEDLADEFACFEKAYSSEQLKSCCSA